MKTLKYLSILGCALALYTGYRQDAAATVTNQAVNTISSLGNGSAHSFVIGFDFRDNSQIVVTQQDETAIPYTRTNLPFGSGAGKFTFAGTANPATTVVTGTAPSTTQRIIISRSTPLDQSVHFDDAAAFPSTDTEAQMDNMVFMLQEIEAQQNRALALAPTSIHTPTPILPDPVADTFLLYNHAGTDFTLTHASPASSQTLFFNGSGWTFSAAASSGDILRFDGTNWAPVSYITSILSTTFGGTGKDFSASTGDIVVDAGVMSANPRTGTGSSVHAASPTFTGTVSGANYTFTGTGDVTGKLSAYSDFFAGSATVGKTTANDPGAAMTIQGNSGAGAGRGLRILSGSNSSDYPIYISNSANNADLFKIDGNGSYTFSGGGVTTGAATFSAATTFASTTAHNGVATFSSGINGQGYSFAGGGVSTGIVTFASQIKGATLTFSGGGNITGAMTFGGATTYPGSASIDGSGNITAGASFTLPNAVPLYVKDSGGTVRSTIVNDASNNMNFYQAYTSGGNLTVDNFSSTGSLILKTNDTAALTIDSSQNLTVNNASTVLLPNAASLQFKDSSGTARTVVLYDGSNNTTFYQSKGTSGGNLNITNASTTGVINVSNNGTIGAIMDTNGALTFSKQMVGTLQGTNLSFSGTETVGGVATFASGIQGQGFTFSGGGIAVGASTFSGASTFGSTLAVNGVSTFASGIQGQGFTFAGGGRVNGALTFANYGTGLLHSNSSGVVTSSAVDVSSADATGVLAAGRFPALTGDITTSSGALATTAAATQSNITSIPNLATVGTVTSGTWNAGAVTSSGALTVNGTGNSTVAGNIILSKTGSGTGLSIGASTFTSFNGSGSNSGIVVTGTSNGAELDLGRSGGAISVLETDAADNTELYNASDKQLKFYTGGNSASNLRLTMDSTAFTFGGAGVFTNSSIKMTALGTGTNADTVCYNSNGTLQIQAAACTISSRRFKENISDLPDHMGIEEVMQLKPVEFNMKAMEKPNPDTANFGRTQVGLIAEDVEKVDRRLAIYEDDGVTPKSYRQEAMIGLLVKAVQDQQREIKDLSHEVGKLRRRR